MNTCRHIASLQDKIRHLESILTEQNLALAQRQAEDLSPAFDVVDNGASTSLPVAECENARSTVPVVPAGTFFAVTQEADGFNKPLPPVQWLTPSDSTNVQPSVNTHRHQGLVDDGEMATSDLNCLHRPAGDDESEDDEESGADADGMGAIASSTNNEAGAGGKPVSEKAYFGPSSTLGFMKHIQDVFRPTKGSRAHKTTRKDNNHEHGESSNQSAKPTSPLISLEYRHTMHPTHSGSFARHKYTLPMRELADALLSSYWTHVHPIYPYLFKSAFNQRYQRLWSAANATHGRARSTPVHIGQAIDYSEDCYSNEPLFFCILNLVFSLGSQYSHSVDSSERCETGNIFFQRAKEFINLDSLENSDLAVVQALLLMGHYLQSTDKSSMCWNITGLAIRVSQSIGLDIPLEYNHSADESSNQLEVEVRKRLWGGCILHDRYYDPLLNSRLFATFAEML